MKLLLSSLSISSPLASSNDISKHLKSSLMVPFSPFKFMDSDYLVGSSVLVHTNHSPHSS